MHEHIGKRAKMRRIKESQTGGIKQARQAGITTSHRMEKGVYQAHQHHGDMSHKWLHPTNHEKGWMQPRNQVAPKIDKHKPTKGTKHCKRLDLDKQIWI